MGAFTKFKFLTSIFNMIFILNKDDKLSLFNQTSEKWVSPEGSNVNSRKKKVLTPEINFTVGN